MNFRDDALLLCASCTLSAGVCIAYTMSCCDGYAYFDSLHEGWLEAVLSIIFGLMGFVALLRK